MKMSWLRIIYSSTWGIPVPPYVRFTEINQFIRPRLSVGVWNGRVVTIIRLTNWIEELKENELNETVTIEMDISGTSILKDVVVMMDPKSTDLGTPNRV